MANKLCDPCLATGLPLLPVRYVPVPHSVKLALPGWAGGQRVTDIDLGAEHHYALRTLRSGYVYLFYAKHARGRDHWECYSVSGDGCLMKQPDARMVLPPMPEFQCSRQGHSNVRLHHLVIEQPEKCGATWIAFSEHKWSDETLKEYTDNTKLRNARMQTLHPAAMAGGAKHSHGTPATEAALNEVIEYSAAFGTDQLPHNTAAGTFSKEDGSFDANRLIRQSTRYPWYQRQGQAAQAVQSMHERASKPDGTHHTAHVLALWDAVGMAHELNGYRNDAAGWLKKYGQERELEITALNAIEGVKKALEKHAGDEASDIADNLWRWDSHRSEDRLKNTASLGAQRRANEQKLVKLWEQDAAQRVPRGLAQQRSGYVDRSAAEFDAGMKTVDASIARMRANRAADPKYAERRSQFVQRAIAGAWPKYEEKLDRPAIDKFHGHWQKLLTQADTIIDRRTEVLVKWLEAPLFIDTLEDFHPNNAADGVRFEDAVGDAIFGMGSSKAGASKIDKWVKEAKASVKTNLLWRAIALNQQDGIVAVDAALQVAAGTSQVLTSAAWTNIGAQIKWNKIADLHKKSVSLFNANRKAGVSPVNTQAIDKLLITVGDAIMKPFAKVTDTLNEKVIQTLLLLRSGVTVQAATALVEAQSRLEGVSRARLIQRLNTTKAFVAAEVTAERAELNKRWAALKATADVPDAKGFSAVKELRLGLVVAVLEGVNLWKISSHVSNDPKVQWQLRAAKMATSAACLDLAATAIKGMHSAKDLAVSFQVLKVAGGVLSCGASFIGGALDVGNMWDAGVGGQYGAATLYLTRAFAQFSGGSITLVVAVSYAAPLLEAAAARYAGSIVINAASRLATWAFAARAGLMFAGLGLSMATLAISIAIWYFSDDALQDWCEESAFGSKPQRKRFSSSELQLKALEAALLEVI